MPLQAKAAAFLIQRRAGSSSGVARVASHAIGRGPRRGNMQLSAILRAPTPSDARIVGSEADTSRYAAGVSHDVNSVTVEATANDSGAIVVFNAEDDAHIAADHHQIRLDVGPSPVSVRVTAKVGTTRTYSVIAGSKSPEPARRKELQDSNSLRKRASATASPQIPRKSPVPQSDRVPRAGKSSIRRTVAED